MFTMYKYITSLFLILGILFTGKSNETEFNCYEIKYLFLTIAELCVKYKIGKNTIETIITATSKGLFKLIKDVKYEGYSIADINLNSKKFYFYRKEKESIEIHRYIFKKNKIIANKIIKKGNNEKKENKIYANDNYIDPFTASLLYYRKIKKKEKIQKKIFYDGNFYYIIIILILIENMKIL